MRREAVVVTGASSGIGAATAELLAREGFTVFAGVRTDEAAAKVGALHGRVRPILLDVTKLVRRLGPKAAEHYARELEMLFRGAEAAERSGMAVGLVTRAILHALTARVPKAHYLIGSRIASFVGTLPVPIQDRLFSGKREKSV